MQHTWDALTLFAFTKLGANNGFRQRTFSEPCTNTCVALGARTNYPPGGWVGQKFSREREVTLHPSSQNGHTTPCWQQFLCNRTAPKPHVGDRTCPSDAAESNPQFCIVICCDFDPITGRFGEHWSLRVVKCALTGLEHCQFGRRIWLIRNSLTSSW